MTAHPTGTSAEDPFDDANELLPLLWSATSPLARELLEVFPHTTLVPGKLFVGLNMMATTAPGASFAGLMAEAVNGLARGLRTETDGDGVTRVWRDGPLVSSAIVLPDFHQRLAAAVGAERLLVGVPHRDALLVTPADSPAADSVHETVLTTEHRASPLLPTLLLVDSTRSRVIAERVPAGSRT